MEDGLVRPSKSPYAAPPVPVMKQSTKTAHLFDYKALNAQTKSDMYPMPLVDACSRQRHTVVLNDGPREGIS